MSLDTNRGVQSATYGQLTTSTTVAQLLLLNSGRKYVRLQNQDTTISIYYGSTTAVSSTNAAGILLGSTSPLAVAVLDYTGAIYVVAASGAPKVSYFDFYTPRNP